MFENCVNCGNATLEERHGVFTFKLPSNFDEASIDLPDSYWLECQDCGERILPPKLRKELEKCRYRLLELLTPSEIYEIRKKAGLTQQEISYILGVGEKTYTRWEAGRSLQSKSSDTLIRVFAMNPDLFVEIRAKRRPNRNIEIERYLNSVDSIKGQNKYGLAAHGDLSALSSESVLAIREKIKEAVIGR